MFSCPKEKQEQTEGSMEYTQRPVPEKPAPKPTASDRNLRIFALFVIALATGLIVAAARGDLWLDEIWSIMIANSADSFPDIFSRFQHDNNHVLNTLYFFWIGNQKVLYVYRLLSIASGIGSLLLAGIIARKWGKTEPLFSLLLIGTSYPLILYFSEARGYAPAIFCALLCFGVLKEGPPRINAYKVVIFWVASILGILSHATFVIVIAALLCWFVVQEMNQHADLKTKGLRVGLYFLIPIAFFVCFYVFYIRHIQIGGGPIYSKWDVVCRAASLVLGLPEGPFWGPLALTSAVVITAAGTVMLFREKSPDWVFYPVVLFFAPMLLVVITQPTYLYFRYFIVSIPFFYLLLGYLVSRGYRSENKRLRWSLVAIVVIFVMAQAQRTIPLLLLGRGNYMAAVQYIISSSEKDVIGIGSDHDFRNKVLLAFYTELLPEPNRLYYIDQPDWKKAGPDWIVTHHQDTFFRPPKQLAIREVGNYKLVKEFRFAGISGWHWFLYRFEKKG